MGMGVGVGVGVGMGDGEVQETEQKTLAQKSTRRQAQACRQAVRKT